MDFKFKEPRRLPRRANSVSTSINHLSFEPSSKRKRLSYPQLPIERGSGSAGAEKPFHLSASRQAPNGTFSNWVSKTENKENQRRRIGNTPEESLDAKFDRVLAKFNILGRRNSSDDDPKKVAHDSLDRIIAAATPVLDSLDLFAQMPNPNVRRRRAATPTTRRVAAAKSNDFSNHYQEVKMRFEKMYPQYSAAVEEHEFPVPKSVEHAKTFIVNPKYSNVIQRDPVTNQLNVSSAFQDFMNEISFDVGGANLIEEEEEEDFFERFTRNETQIKFTENTLQRSAVTPKESMEKHLTTVPATPPNFNFLSPQVGFLADLNKDNEHKENAFDWDDFFNIKTPPMFKNSDLASASSILTSTQQDSASGTIKVKPWKKMAPAKLWFDD